MFDIIEFIKEDLRNAGISNFSLENIQFLSNDMPEILECSNSIIYIYFCRASQNDNLTFKSYDFDVEIKKKKSNSSIFKFLNPIFISNCVNLKFVKANFTRE